MSGSTSADATAGLLRLLDKWRPARALEPHEVFQLRFLVGGLHLGLLVALYSLATGLNSGTGLGSVLVAAMAAALVALLLGARAGLPLRALGWACVALVAAFFTSASLVTVELQPDQICWFVLLPLIARILSDSPEVEPGRRARPLLAASALAVGLGIFVVVAHAQGLTFGRLTPASSTFDRISDYCTFVATLIGMVGLYDLTLRSTEDELRLLRRLLSICAWCKKIRAADERWVTVEEYLTAPVPLASARPFGPAQPAAPGTPSEGLSHGICPTCLAEHFPDAQ